MVAPVVQASMVSAGADILSGAFGGGGSHRSRARDLRKQYQYKARYAGTELPGYVNQARKAGLHPLFAMGASGGQSPTFNMQGQSQTGSFATDGLKAVSRHYSRMAELEAQKDLINAQAQASALRVAENNTSNDTDGALVDQANTIDPKLQEFKKGEVVAHDPKSKQKGMGVRPLTNAITIGDQNIQFAVEEAADIMEDPVKIIGLAMIDRNNTGVNWRKAIRDYAGIAHPRDYKARNLAERVITKELFWGLAKLKRHYKIPKYMGR